MDRAISPQGSAEQQVLRFRIDLQDVTPEVWREIEVPAEWSFWLLHVAIQDAMGWLDCHLHAFVPAAGGERFVIGIPEGCRGESIEAGWDVPVARHFEQVGDRLFYKYDFGDGWRHELRLVSRQAADPALGYPRCVDGRGACPPEHCGGPPGYADLLDKLSGPRTDAYYQMVEWLRGHDGKHWPFDPEAFSVAAVRFSDGDERRRRLRPSIDD